MRPGACHRAAGRWTSGAKKSLDAAAPARYVVRSTRQFSSSSVVARNDDWNRNRGGLPIRSRVEPALAARPAHSSRDPRQIVAGPETLIYIHLYNNNNINSMTTNPCRRLPGRGRVGGAARWPSQRGGQTARGLESRARHQH